MKLGVLVYLTMFYMVSERYNHPFQNPAHKTFLEDFLKIQKILNNTS